MTTQKVRIRYEVIIDVHLEKSDDKIAKRMAQSLQIVPGELDKEHVTIAKQMCVPHSMMLI